MKKYAMLIIFTIVAAVTIVFSGQFAKNSIVKVNITDIKPVTVENSIICTGKVEYVADGNVYAPVSSFTKKVYVKAGDKVVAGQTLMELSVVSSSSVSVDNQSAFNKYGAYAAYLNQAENAQSSAADSGSAQSQLLTAPTDGVITSVSVSGEGYYVDPTKPAVVIKSDSGLQVRLSVNEAQISDIKEGQPVKITGVGFKNSNYSGTVKSISSNATQVVLTSGMETVVDVIVSVDNAGDDIKPGYTAKAKIITSKSTNILVAPYEAVRSDESGNEYVYRVVGKKAVKTAIVTNKELDDGFEIKKGLYKNDKIIINPNNILNGEHVLPVVGKAVSSNG